MSSDNGTNFIGASNVLKQLQQAFDRSPLSLEFYAASSGVKFTFIPPWALHFGGLWEAAAKQGKFLFLHAVDNASVTQEETETMLAETEAVDVNSRNT